MRLAQLSGVWNAVEMTDTPATHAAERRTGVNSAAAGQA